MSNTTYIPSNELLTPVRIMASRCFIDHTLVDGVISIDDISWKCPELTKPSNRHLQIVYVLPNNMQDQCAVFASDECGDAVFIGVARKEPQVFNRVTSRPKTDIHKQNKKTEQWIQDNPDKVTYLATGVCTDNKLKRMLKRK